MKDAAALIKEMFLALKTSESALAEWSAAYKQLLSYHQHKAITPTNEALKLIENI